MNKKELLKDLSDNIEQMIKDHPKLDDLYLIGYNKGWIQGLTYAKNQIKRVSKKEIE